MGEFGVGREHSRQRWKKDKGIAGGLLAHFVWIRDYLKVIRRK